MSLNPNILKKIKEKDVDSAVKEFVLAILVWESDQERHHYRTKYVELLDQHFGEDN